MREEKYILRWKAFLPAAGMALVSTAVIAAASFLVPEGGRQGEVPPQAESGGDAAGFDISRMEDADFSAVITSDLHFRDHAAHRAEIAADPYCRKLLSALEGTNYGPWIRYEMETAALPGNALFIPAGGRSP